jgi:DNA-binding Lrp family transcriptional regulator
MLSKDAVKYRISKMQERGLILAFYPQIDFSMLGFSKFQMKLLLDESRKEEQVKMLDALKKHPNVRSIIEFSDRWDVEVSVLARSLKDFDAIDIGLTENFRDVIHQKDNVAVVKNFLVDLCPLEFQLDKSYLEKLKELPFQEKPQLKVDDKDLQILKQLSLDCRASTYEIQRHVKLSADAIGLRIKRMVKSGLIEKFTIALNFSMLGYHMYSFEADIVSINSEDEKRLIEFAIYHPFIFSAKKMLGFYDVIIKIMSKSPRDTHTTIEAVKQHFSSVIREYETLIAFREHCFVPFPEALLTPEQNLKA